MPVTRIFHGRSKTVAIVLLAAGESTRMGTCKALLPWREQTVLDAVCSALVKGTELYTSYRIIVTGREEEALRTIAERYGFHNVHNEHPAEGQGTSIRLGVEAAESLAAAGGAELDGVLCSVSDQPLLQPYVLERLMQVFCEGTAESVVMPVYGADRQPGNPVLFGRAWFSALKELTGDVGGRRIIHGVAKEFVRKVWIEESCGVDIDTPEDYQTVSQIVR